mgnify:FL=1
MHRKALATLLFAILGLLLIGSALPLPIATAATPTPGSPAGGFNQTGLTGVVHGLYFYSTDCTHCMAVLDEVITPLQVELGDRLDLRLVEINTPENYELLLKTEETFQVSNGQRAIPVTVLGNQVLVGEDANRAELPGIIQTAAQMGGLDFPAIPGLDPSILQSTNPGANPAATECATDSTDGCAVAAPMYAAYFYQVGCQECSRAEVDLNYLRQKYPSLVVEEFNIYEDAALGQWLADRAGRTDFHSPALFIGDQAWIGEEEINPQTLVPVLDAFAAEGAPRVWETFDPEHMNSTLVERFRSMGWLTVVFAGLVDGLNPCAFATLIFFVSYLTLSGRKGKAVLLVGIAFTVGVFLAYLVVGLGFYKVLDLLGNWLNIISRWVYALTALFCLGLAVFSFLDYLKARRGKIEDMALNLPKPLRMKINAVIRDGRQTRAYAAGAFITGILISFLELACTGQVYLPTIIFVSSMPELRLQAVTYLILYNILFILPLVVVFVLAYFGTTSRDLTAFLQKHAAAVKIGMMILFLSLAIWLGVSVLL